MDVDEAKVDRRCIGCRQLIRSGGMAQVCSTQQAEMVGKVVGHVQGEFVVDMCTSEEVKEYE